MDLPDFADFEAVEAEDPKSRCRNCGRAGAPHLVDGEWRDYETGSVMCPNPSGWHEGMRRHSPG
jgi:hypothetical protein